MPAAAEARLFGGAWLPVRSQSATRHQPSSPPATPRKSKMTFGTGAAVMNTDNPYATTTPVSPALARLLTDAAGRLGLDNSAAQEAARRGALMIDNIALVTFVLPATGLARHDTLAV